MKVTTPLVTRFISSVFARPIALSFFFCISVSMNAQILDVTITNIRDTPGCLCLAIFDNDLGYKRETPLITKYIHKDTLLCDTVRIDMPVSPGTYAITVLDDEDGDEKMRFNFLGIPREGLGFSNYTLKGIRKPCFDDFSFTVKENERVSILVKMKYF